jgi:hypothetical protein
MYNENKLENDSPDSDYTLLSWDRAIAQADSCRILTAEARFAPRSIHVGFVVDKVALGQIVLLVLRFSPVNIIPPLLHYSSMYQMGDGQRGPLEAKFHTDIVLPHNNTAFLHTLTCHNKYTKRLSYSCGVQRVN